MKIAMEYTRPLHNNTYVMISDESRKEIGESPDSAKLHELLNEARSE